MLVCAVLGLNLYVAAGIYTRGKYHEDHLKYRQAEDKYMEAMKKMEHYGKPQEENQAAYRAYGYAKDPLTTWKKCNILLFWPLTLWKSS